MNSFGARLKKARARAGMTQQQLAVAVDVAVTQVSRWERDTTQPSLESLRALTRTLKISLDELVGA